MSQPPDPPPPRSSAGPPPVPPPVRPPVPRPTRPATESAAAMPAVPEPPPPPNPSRRPRPGSDPSRPAIEPTAPVGKRFGWRRFGIVAAVVVLTGIGLGGWWLTERQRDRAANAAVDAAVAKAEAWLSDPAATTASEPAIERALSEAAASPRATNAAAAVKPMLSRVRSRQVKLADRDAYAAAVAAADAGRFEEAATLLKGRDDGPKSDAGRLTAELRIVRAPAAGERLRSLSNESLDAFATTGALPGPLAAAAPSRPALKSAFAAALATAVPAEQARRETARLAAVAERERLRKDPASWPANRLAAQAAIERRATIAGRAARLARERNAAIEAPLIEDSRFGRFGDEAVARLWRPDDAARTLTLSDVGLAWATSPDNDAESRGLLESALNGSSGFHIAKSTTLRLWKSIQNPETAAEELRSIMADEYRVNAVVKGRPLKLDIRVGCGVCVRKTAASWYGQRWSSVPVRIGWIVAESDRRIAEDEVAERRKAGAGGMVDDRLTEVDPSRDAVHGTWAWDAGFLTNNAPDALIALPDPPDRDYVLSAVVRRVEGRGPLNVLLPVGPRRMTLECFAGGETGSLDDDEPHLLTVRVTTARGDRTGLSETAVTIDGLPLDLAATPADAAATGPAADGPARIGFGVREGRYEIQDVRRTPAGDAGTLDWLHVSRPELRTPHDWLRHFLAEYAPAEGTWREAELDALAAGRTWHERDGTRHEGVAFALGFGLLKGSAGGPLVGAAASMKRYEQLDAETQKNIVALLAETGEEAALLDTGGRLRTFVMPGLVPFGSPTSIAAPRLIPRDYALIVAVLRVAAVGQERSQHGGSPAKAIEAVFGSDGWLAAPHECPLDLKGFAFDAEGRKVVTDVTPYQHGSRGHVRDPAGQTRDPRGGRIDPERDDPDRLRSREGSMR